MGRSSSANFAAGLEWRRMAAPMRSWLFVIPAAQATVPYNLPGPSFSWLVLFTLLLVLGVSALVFVWQVRRWTTHRGWRALLDWSRERGFRLSRPADKAAGEPFDRL